MTYYSKLIAAIVGLIVLLAAKYGLDLQQHTQLITDAIVAVATAVGVYSLQNKPKTPEQIKERSELLKEAKEDAKEVKEA